MDEPDPAARARRRTFSAEYKAAIVEEYDALPEHDGERGALLRREGLYSSHISEWRKARDTAGRDALAPKPRLGKRTAAEIELEKVRRENERLTAELAKTKLALEITGKAVDGRGGPPGRMKSCWGRLVTPSSLGAFPPVEKLGVGGFQEPVIVASSTHLRLV